MSLVGLETRLWCAASPCSCETNLATDWAITTLVIKRGKWVLAARVGEMSAIVRKFTRWQLDSKNTCTRSIAKSKIWKFILFIKDAEFLACKETVSSLRNSNELLVHILGSNYQTRMKVIKFLETWTAKICRIYPNDLDRRRNKQCRPRSDAAERGVLSGHVLLRLTQQF